MQNEKKQFVLSKTLTAYLVALQGFDVVVTPIHDSKFTSATRAIARSLQIIGQSRLLMRHPPDSFQYLREFYEEIGWNIEEVD